MQVRKRKKLKKAVMADKDDDKKSVNVFVDGVSMSGEAEIKNDNNRSAENDTEKPEGEEVNNSE